MVHKFARGVKYDEDGDVIMENMTPSQRLYFTLRDYHSYTTEKTFNKVFNEMWKEFGMQIDAHEFEGRIEIAEDDVKMAEMERR